MESRERAWRGDVWITECVDDHRIVPVPGVYIIRLSAFDGEATTSDDLIVTSNAPAGSGTGLLAQYFNDAGSGIYFTALVLTRTDATVDFDWAAGSPDPAVQADNFSVRWSGQVQAPVSGTYTFTHAVGRWRALVCERAAAGRQLDRSCGDDEQRHDHAVGGQRYDIRMDYYDKGSWRRRGCRGRIRARTIR